MSEQTPWKGDPKQRKSAVKFGVAVFAVLFIVVLITSLSRYFGW